MRNKATYTQYQAGVFDISVNDDTNNSPIQASYTGDGTSGIEVYGLQEETGGFATPYIPTLASAVARGADDASNFTSSFGLNATEGAVIVTFTPQSCGAGRIFALSDGTANNRIVGHVDASGNVKALVTVGGVVQADIDTLQNAISGSQMRIALTYKANDIAVSAGGLIAVTDTSGTIPAMTTLEVGGGPSGAPLNGDIANIAYYPTRLANAILVK